MPHQCHCDEELGNSEGKHGSEVAQKEVRWQQKGKEPVVKGELEDGTDCHQKQHTARGVVLSRRKNAVLQGCLQKIWKLSDFMTLFDLLMHNRKQATV